jgi:COP9 signalosome complex subunit 1
LSQARIDSHNKILFAKEVDQRTVTFKKALLMGKAWQRRTRALMLRAAMLRHGNIQVKSPASGRDEGISSGSNHTNHINNSQ